MNFRFGVIAGGVIAGGVAVLLAVAPAIWLADMLDVTGHDATTFLVRRYAASATAALAVVAIATARRTEPRRAVLLGFGTWFGLQAVTASWGLIAGVVGGFAWLAMVADPLIAAWFLYQARTSLRPIPSPQVRDRDASH